MTSTDWGAGLVAVNAAGGEIRWDGVQPESGPAPTAMQFPSAEMPSDNTGPGCCVACVTEKVSRSKICRERGGDMGQTARDQDGSWGRKGWRSA